MRHYRRNSKITAKCINDQKVYELLSSITSHHGNAQESLQGEWLSAKAARAEQVRQKYTCKAKQK